MLHNFVCILPRLKKKSPRIDPDFLGLGQAPILDLITVQGGVEVVVEWEAPDRPGLGNENVLGIVGELMLPEPCWLRVEKRGYSKEF